MPIILTELQTKYLFENGRVLENSDGSYVFWKDRGTLSTATGADGRREGLRN